jgi:hypothetical protein
MKNASYYRITAFIYDAYNKLKTTSRPNFEHLSTHHGIGKHFYQQMLGRCITNNGKFSKDWVWIGGPPTQQLIDECIEGYKMYSEAINKKYRNKEKVEQKAVHHEIAPGFNYIDLTGENPPVQLERLTETPDPVRVTPVVDAKLVEQYVKAQMLEIMTKMFGNEKDAAGDGNRGDGA